jgi:hypothetical protein
MGLSSIIKKIKNEFFKQGIFNAALEGISGNL